MLVWWRQQRRRRCWDWAPDAVVHGGREAREGGRAGSEFCCHQVYRPEVLPANSSSIVIEVEYKLIANRYIKSYGDQSRFGRQFQIKTQLEGNLTRLGTVQYVNTVQTSDPVSGNYRYGMQLGNAISARPKPYIYVKISYGKPVPYCSIVLLARKSVCVCRQLFNVWIRTQ
jgi:hypothetical protein